ncbi:MAG: class I SAM-dependent methyltransferase [Solirubrobacteraceae bacterium]
MKSDYVFSQRRSPDVERTRLRLLEEYHDPVSASQLDAIGVGEGWHCLDVGAGGGSVTRMLAERIGRAGSVLAVDLDTSLLDELASDLVEVRRLDLMRDQFPEAAFDLVHARLLLMFLSPRLGALERLVNAVHADYISRSAPGGSLLSRLLSLTIERLREQMIPIGADGGEIDEARRLLEDPANTIASPTTCVAHGRRPYCS